MLNAETEPDSGYLPAPIPANESERMAALRALDILDSAEEDIYNSITQAAADVCQTSMASLTFIDRDRQWFKSRLGLNACEGPRESSFCAHAIGYPDLFHIPDTLEDDRFRNNPLVAGEPHLRFYAGIPLRTSTGLGLGTLCVLDTVPRRLDRHQLNALASLATNVMRVLELRKLVGVAIFAKAVDFTGDGITIADVDRGVANVIYANESFRQATGFTYLDALNQSPAFPIGADCAEATAALADALAQARMTTVDCRFHRKDGELRWSRVSFVPYVDQSHVIKYLVTIHRDITATREAEVQAQHLYAMRTTMASVAHVVKNFLNSAQLYSSQVTPPRDIDPAIQRSFLLALENTRSELAAIDRMSAFRQRPTPFGFSMLDTKDEA